MRITGRTLIILTLCAASGYAANWPVPDAKSRVAITIHAGFHPRRGEVVEVPLAGLPDGPVRVLAKEELTAFRDDAAGVLRFVLPGPVPAYEQMTVHAYFGSGSSSEAAVDERLKAPRLRTLLKNGGFERDLDGWTLRSDRAVKATVVSEQPHSGAKCLRLDFDGKGDCLQCEPFPVTAGTRLTVDAWMRVTLFERPKPHIGSPVRVIVEMFDEKDERVGRFSWSWNPCIVGEDWRLVQAWSDVPPTAKTARVDIRNWWCKSTAFLDDIAVYVFQPPSCEVTIGQVERR